MFDNRLKDSFIVNCFKGRKNDESSSPLLTSSSRGLSKHILKFRSKFAVASEKSPCANFLSYLYKTLLDCPLSVLSVFLGVFSIVCFTVNYFSAQSKAVFILSGTSQLSIILFVIALITFPVNRDLATLLNVSRIFSKFKIAYDRKFLNIANNYQKHTGSYSSAFFLGILCGILTLIYSPVKILFFISLLIFSVVTVNHPEFGILLIAFLIPVIKSHYLVALIYGTFIALLYKYFIGKRHISFGTAEYLLLACSFMFVMNGIFNASSVSGIYEAARLVSAFLAFICIKNLVKSTSVYKCCIDLISNASIIITILVIIKFALSLLLSGKDFSLLYTHDLVRFFFDRVLNSSFIPVYIAAVLPVNLCILISKSRQYNKTKYLLAVIAQLFCVVMYYDLRITVGLSVALAVVFAVKKLWAVLTVPIAPFAAYLLHTSIHSFLQGISMYGISKTDYSSISTAAKQIISDNFLFGIGLGEENFSHVLSYHAFTGAQNFSHPPSTFDSMLISFGIIGTVFLLLTVCYLLVKCLGMCFLSQKKIEIIDASSAGIFASCIFSCIAFCTYFAEINFIVLFSIFASLAFSVKNCIDSEYIDLNTIR